MLECNLKLVSQVFLLANASKSARMHGTRLCGVVPGLHSAIIILSRGCVGWSEPVNMYFLSHDIRHVLCLVLYMTTFTFSWTILSYMSLSSSFFQGLLRIVAICLSFKGLKITNTMGINSSYQLLVTQGLFSKRRQLILTDAPRLYYVDPVAMELKGEIPW